MSPSRFQLEGPSLAEVTARAHAEYGPRAKIIAAEAVTTGGISGFFAQRHYEVTIEVPDDTAQDAHEFDLPARAGIAALLDDADNGDMGIIEEPIAPTLSTTSVDFAAIMADLTVNTATTEKDVAQEGPPPLTGSGDLIVVVGLGDDALRIARTMTGIAGDNALRTAGDLFLPAVDRTDNRRSILTARAAGVEGHHAIVVVFGLAGSDVDFARTDALGRLHADQVWLAVDASRKEADTRRWVAGVRAAVTVDAMVAFGRGLTATPETVAKFGLPVSWSETGSEA